MEHASNHEICNWTHGLQCFTCKTFFPNDSPIYRRFSGRSNWLMVLHNINAERIREGLASDPRIESMYERIDASKNATDDEIAALFEEAAALAAQFGKDADSASITLRDP